ncbi:MULTISPECIES: hypothetical protein [Fischerella]|nr:MULTISPECIES: hypothetical protein [Fischerella]
MLVVSCYSSTPHHPITPSPHHPITLPHTPHLSIFLLTNDQ